MVALIVMALGVSFMPLVRYPALILLALISNPLYVLGILLLYYGTCWFLGGRPRVWIVLLIFFSFLLPYLYYALVEPSLWHRSIIVGLAFAAGFILISITILRHILPHYRNSALFTVTIFLIAAAFTLFRIGNALLLPLNYGYQDIGPLLSFSFLFHALTSIFWTFGFILIHRDRLAYTPASSDATRAPESLSSPSHPYEPLSQLYNLSEREAEVAEFLGQGYTYEQIAEICFISKNTVKTHLKTIYAKCEVASRTQLLLKLVTPPRSQRQA